MGQFVRIMLCVMLTEPGLDRLQQVLLELVFGLEIAPQAAVPRAVRAHPEVPLLTWVFVLTTIATNLRGSFQPEAHWSYTDWIEAAASLGCDIYALDAIGHPQPDGHDLTAFWDGRDPHLT